ncbi:MAG TPA: PQQ-dependent sugar dehydrogenase [Streptosporangiaceae bacterium]|nr:PQQ-dependent sugar dehydrogenase [Streptosporangiaceae bacterium]
MRPRTCASFGAALLLAGGCALAGCSSDAESSGGPGGGAGAGAASTPAPLPSASAQTGRARPGTPQEVATGLSVPWAIAFLPGGDALVTERDSARLLRVTPFGQVTVIGKVPGVEASGEGGLLGVAVGPSFLRDRYVYVYFSTGSDNRIVRFVYPSGGGIERPRNLVTGIPHGAIHNGGRLAFGPDGMLYASTGETGDTGLAQDRDSLGGKILRLDPDGAPAPGNPFGTRVYTYGHRNVQGMAWDGAGRMFATEFGQNRFDELNRIIKGRNYGWPEVEGLGGDDDRFTDPLLTWTTDEASPSGLAFSGGSLWVAALRGERLWQVPLSRGGAAGRPIARLDGRYGRLRAVATAPDGSLWVSTSNRDGRGSPRSGDDKIIAVPLR